MSETELVNAPKPKPRGLMGLLLKWGGFVKFSHTLFAMPFALASMMVASREHYFYLEGAKAALPPEAVEVRFPRRETFCADHRLYGLRADVRDGVQPHRRSQVRRKKPAHRRTPPAGRRDQFVQRVVALRLERRGLSRRRRFHQHRLPCARAGGAVFHLLLLAHKTLHRLHAHLARFALALAPVGAWIAVKGGTMAELFQMLPLGQSLLPPVVLGISVVFWLIGFDIIYAMQDFEFDRQHGLRSLVTAWGPKNALTAAFLSHMIMLGLILIFGILLKMRVAFPHRLVDYFVLSRVRALARPQAQLELDQHVIFQAQRPDQLGLSFRRGH